MSDFEDEYMKLVGWLHHAAEQAEAHVERANRLVRTLSDTGLLAREVILGPVILQQNYHSDAGRPDGTQTVQVVLDLPRGLGVVYWDTDEYHELVKLLEDLELVASARFSPFANCQVAVKALCFPHIAGLLNEMKRRLG